MLRQRRFAILKSYYDFGTFVSLNREEGSATCCIPGAKEVPKCKECNLLLVFTKRLCNIFSDELDRFPKGAGYPGGKADWGWVQIILASLKPQGRAAVVLDTGATSRGSAAAVVTSGAIATAVIIRRTVIHSSV